VGLQIQAQVRRDPDGQVCAQHEVLHTLDAGVCRLKPAGLQSQRSGLQTPGARVCIPARLGLQPGAWGLQSYHAPPNSAIHTEITHNLQ